MTSATRHLLGATVLLATGALAAACGPVKGNTASGAPAPRHRAGRARPRRLRPPRRPPRTAAPRRPDAPRPGSARTRTWPRPARPSCPASSAASSPCTWSGPARERPGTHRRFATRALPVPAPPPRPNARPGTIASVPMNDLSPRLRAVCDLDLAEAREYSGRHEYDGTIQDLSPDGVRKGLAALAEAASSGEALEDAHDEAHLAAFEARARVMYGELELYRRNPLIHLGGLDLACYDRDYAPQAERDRARLAQLAAWPQAVDAAVAALDQVSAPV